MYCLYVNWARFQEFHSSRHMCCGDMTIKVIWFDLLRFKKAQITVNFFMGYMIKILYKIHWLSCILSSSLQKTDPTPNLPSCTEASGIFSPTTDSSAQPTDGRATCRGVCGAFSRRKNGAGAEDQAPEPVYRTWVCMCVFAVLMRRVCVCLEHCLLAIFQHHMHRLVKKCISLLFWLLLHATLFWD